MIMLTGGSRQLTIESRQQRLELYKPVLDYRQRIGTNVTYSKRFCELFAKRYTPYSVGFRGSLHFLADASPCLVYTSVTIATCIAKHAPCLLNQTSEISFANNILIVERNRGDEHVD